MAPTPLSSPRTRRLAAIVIAVPELDPAIAAYERLGFAVTDRSPRTGWGIEAAMLGVEGGMLELIAPTDPDLPVGRGVSRFLDKRGPGLYMVSFEIEDADAEYEALLAAGVNVPAPPVDAPGDAGMSPRLFWPSPADTGGALVEFMQLDGGREA
jgi:methylmalonyl-CoA/ethylmalonyl-CoA epimerase